MKSYVALLRGINVGGKNLIKMTDLAACFEGMGFSNIRTYIQSGNVIFGSDEGDKARLIRQIEETLTKTFPYEASIVLRSETEMKAIVANAPEGFGREPDAYRYDVIFLKELLTATEAMQSIRIREGVDQAWIGNEVLYFSRLTSRASQSYLSRMIGLPIYQQMTIRNWNTTTKLLELIEKAGLEKEKNP